MKPDVPRDRRGHIQAADNLKIRPEKHPFNEGDTYNPNHHEQHYHVETRRDPSRNWRNDNNIEHIKPPDYKPGDGTGFRPGQPFPGG